MKRTLYSKLLIAIVMTQFVVMTISAILLGQFFFIFETDASNELHNQYWFYLITVLTLVFIISSFVLAKVIDAYTRSVETANKVANQLAKGNYLARTPMREIVEEDSLSTAINQLGGTLQEFKIQQEMDKERIKTLVESIGSSLIMFGREGNLTLVNGVFERKFQMSRDEMLGKQYYDIPFEAPIEEVIEEVFLTEQVYEKQMRLEREKTKHFTIYGAPVIGLHGNWLGIIIVLHDISKLVQLEEIRREFVANVSHELRTPITSIKGFTETILDGAIEDQEVTRQFLTIIQKESDRLQLLIDDLLELSRIERSGFTMHMQPIILERTLRDAIEVVSAQSEEKQIAITLEGDERISVEADQRRMIQIIVNLLTNAITYSKASTHIQVRYWIEQPFVYIAVQDQGIGIAENEKARLFERFYRIDKARARDSGGTGLGLAIVKHLVEAHQGEIIVESEVNVGTTFTVKFPIRQGKEVKTIAEK